MNIRLLYALPLLTLFLVGCGSPVKIYTNEVAYQLTTTGMEEKEYGPGTKRLETCFVTACPSMLRIQTSKASHEVVIKRVFLPLSNVDVVDVSVGMQFRIREGKENRLLIAKDVPSMTAPDATSSGSERLIDSEAIWKVYLERIAPAAVIDGLKHYTVDQVLSDVVTIGHAIKDIVNESIKGSPIEITELTFSNGIGNVPDEVITAKRKLYAVSEERARTIKSLEAQISIEEKRQTFQKVRLANDKINSADAGIPYDEYVRLKIAERFSDAAENVAEAAEISAQHSIPFAVGNMYPPALTHK